MLNSLQTYFPACVMRFGIVRQSEQKSIDTPSATVIFACVTMFNVVIIEVVTVCVVDVNVFIKPVPHGLDEIPSAKPVPLGVIVLLPCIYIVARTYAYFDVTSINV